VFVRTSSCSTQRRASQAERRVSVVLAHLFLIVLATLLVVALESAVILQGLRT
jgi:hypothetical protein